ncbi:hypothetical protein PENSPDRAFT_641547 [Peniophora sp. CONT]|nr:hypothetical protein PENSPDRAFT_641547 [Peniophora sp. CONT]
MDVDSTPAPAPAPKPTPAPTRQRKSPSPQRTSIPINVHSTKPPSPKPASPQPAPAPAPQHQPQVQIEPTQAAHTAASSIQRTWRRHHALRQLQSLRSKFNELTDRFEVPSVLEYTLKNARESEDGLEEVAEVETKGLPYAGFVRPSPSAQTQPPLDTTIVPPLSYTSSTRAIHAQNEALLRLLNALDAVPSWGDSAVREARKHLAKDVEGEAARLDAWWKAVWREKGASARVKRVRA